ncbi:hypothetical protein IW140_001179 [Coemansia sp. RSA 1813]|nr:hypothetical protein EV178_004952 [Coemansia sp. RSA 1646]KAJ1769999.1 hypothetical protein LPJ74_003573 [Coemansia sp. RSA 1843]KAJ2092086.1 hypothetical protein IW138_001452 [Coemansia sp. RSA 986]KAJ2216578.1 hypothetical protein EV179_001117 [Coemansia sp. RSA 487]KAJ2572139.1 hypothetical protein IW140_001179 [Coemansia sp. RSA 1813]
MAYRDSYEHFCNSLWDIVKWPIDETPPSAGRITDSILQYKEAISKDAADENSKLSVTRQQWTESLAVASSFADPGFSWTTVDMREQANECITAIAAHMDIDPVTLPIDGTTFRSIYMSFVRPYFVSKSRSSTIGQQSTQHQKQQQQQQHDYVLMDAGASGSGNSGSAYKDSSQSDDARWRKNPQCIATFSWALDHLCDDAIAETISSILPVMLALVEDYECHAKLWGLRIVTKLLSRKGWTNFLRKSGIVGAIDKSVYACLLYRSDSKDIAADLLASAFEAAVACAHILHDIPQKSTYAQGWWQLVDKVVANEIYVSDNVAASAVLYTQIGVLCGPLGCAIARYLRPLVGILAQGLRSPVYLSQDICDLHLTIVHQLLVLIDACPQRMHVYGAEIVAALAYSWASTKHKMESIASVDELQQGIVCVVRKLVKICPEETRTCIDRLHRSRPGVFAQWIQEASSTEPANTI